MLKSINPANDKELQTYEEMGEQKISSIIDSTHETFLKWRKTSFKERSEKMLNAAGILKKDKQKFAEMMTLEMGKPIQQSISEVEKCAWVCEYYAENAESFLKEISIKTDASESFVTYNPLGIVLAVMPWNFPFWQVFRFAVPALMAGNAGLLKHASNVTGCALMIENIFKGAGFPENLFRTLILSSSKMENGIRNGKIKAVTLTGSVPAGKAVAKTAGSLLKKTVMELGGSDPYLILEDANLEAASKTCATSKLINGGQSCIAAKRFIVVEKVFDQFKKLFVEQMNSKKMGNPFDINNDLGPQASKRLRDELHQQVNISIEKGAEVLLGGMLPEGKGAFYPPTVLANVKPGMPAYNEELFGPVASLIKAIDEDDAIRIANDSNFGLGAAVFTNDIEKGRRIASERLEAGNCFVNEFVKSDPRLPFGGIKESGYGRELSEIGIKEFVNIKTVYIK